MPQEYVPVQSVLGEIPLAESVLYFDDFEHGLQWQADGTGSDYVADAQSDRSLRGAYSMFTLTKTTPALNDYVTVYRDLYLPPSQRVRWLTHFLIADITYTQTVDFRIRHVSGSAGTYKEFRIRYVTASYVWQYYNGTAWTAISGSSQYFFDVGWNRLTFDVDVENSLYTRLQCNDLDLDISTLVPATGADATGERMRIQLYHDSTGVGQSEIQVDSVMVQAL